MNLAGPCAVFAVVVGVAPGMLVGDDSEGGGIVGLEGVSDVSFVEGLQPAARATAAAVRRRSSVPVNGLFISSELRLSQVATT